MNYKETRNSYLNCEKRVFLGDGEFDFPRLDPVDVNIKDTDVIGFNYAIGCKNPEDKICHFYLDDYQFERVWKNPDRYIDVLKRFKAVLSPDFSLYSDFPKAVQIFNHYRKMWCSAYWQMNGIKVIPTICWSDESSFDWCFDGVPKHSLVSISTIGGFGNHECNKDGWLKGYEKCLEILEPSKILLFGNQYTEIRSYGIMVVVGNSQLKRKKTLSAKQNKGNSNFLEVNNTEVFGDGWKRKLNER